MQKIKVAILGGGCGGLSTAFWLTSTKVLRERFEVTVYQRGWRLGGKGASGRNDDCADRIEEHGLHMWLGCYENAFRTMRACLAEWKPQPASPIKTLHDAFTAQNRITLTELDGGPRGDAWSHWDFTLPRREGEPGDGTRLVWADRLFLLCDWLREALHADGKVPSVARRAAACLVLLMARLGVVGAFLLRALVTAFAAVVRAIRRTPWLERLSILADLGLTVVIGVARDLVPRGTAGFDAMNDVDFREWLEKHGARETTLNCAPVRALYDLGFAYPDGDASSFRNGRGAAGAGLRFLLELALSYKGAPLWKMNAGMGDIVFTPLYEVLMARGVRVEFFHEVVSVALDADAQIVESVVVRRQAELASQAYQPLVTIKGLACWPSAPLWDQLRDGARLKASGVDFENWSDDGYGATRALNAGEDFDRVVMAFPPEMIRRVAPGLSTQSSTWKSMIDNSASVATQAFQLWLRPSLPELGWPHGATVLSAYAPPFDTWADMTSLLPRENWSGDVRPATIAYFCGTLPARDELLGNEVKRNAEEWLINNARFLWPGFRSPRATGDDAVLASYFRRNVDPSERYVQTLPGSVRYRLAPDALPFSNVYLAGDWTKTRYSSGCVEAAMESGMLAARAMSGEPMPIYGH